MLEYFIIHLAHLIYLCMHSSCICKMSLDILVMTHWNMKSLLFFKKKWDLIRCDWRTKSFLCEHIAFLLHTMPDAWQQLSPQGSAWKHLRACRSRTWGMDWVVGKGASSRRKHLSIEQSQDANTNMTHFQKGLPQIWIPYTLAKWTWGGTQHTHTSLKPQEA